LKLYKTGLVLVFIGVILAFAAALLPLLLVALSPVAEGGKVEVAGGGCIVIGFIPVCFGYGNPLLVVVLLVAALIVVVISYVLVKSTLKELKAVSSAVA